MSDFTNIVCKPTNWIKIRLVLMMLMFSIFAYLFYKDGTVGYREKNRQYVMHEVFVGVAQKAVEEVEDEAAWKKLVAESIVSSGDEESIPLPEDFDRTQTWPESLSGAYERLKKESNYGHQLWLDYSGARGWEAKVIEQPEDAASLQVQMGMFYGSAVLAGGVLLLGLWLLGRQMEVTETAYIAPGKREVPFASMRRIDTRKWGTKGIATIEYEQDGKMLKCKIDGMVYGQFKAEDGAPAEKLFQHILSNFKGELVAYEEESADDDEVER